MKLLLAVFAAAAGLACSSSTDLPQQGTAYFTMDIVSCTYTGTKDVTFYIARDEVGTQSMIAGATSTGYLTKASRTYAKEGNPVVQARIGNYTSSGGALWTGRSSITVPANGSVTHTFIC